MKNEKAIELFNEQFRFEINQEVRHRADFKANFSSDLGLLVIQRVLEEQSDDDGNVNFSRMYTCRLIRFSGSGDLARFKESELMTIEEYNRKAVLEEQEREDMRNEMYETKKEIFASFGVKRGTEVYLKDGDNIDKTFVYKVTGFAQGKKEGAVLILKIEAGEGRTVNEVRVKSKSEFVIVKDLNE